MMHQLTRVILFLSVSLIAGESKSQNQEQTSLEAIFIRSLLHQDEENVDLARVKFTIDRMIDPTIDVDVGVSKIDKMVQVAADLAGPFASNRQKLEALKKYIYQAGEWNGFRPYQYDHDDPLGDNITNKLITNYMSSRKGNCITMPFLFILMADRMGLNVSASTAPVHVFVKYTDDVTGITYNLETTSGANPARDEWYNQNLPMTKKAIENGVYMQSLTRKETVAVLATVMVEHLIQEKQYQKAIEIADIIIKAYPKFAYAMVKKGSAFYHLLDENYYKKYPVENDIPVPKRPYYEYLVDNNYFAFKQAEDLGWQPMK